MEVRLLAQVPLKEVEILRDAGGHPLLPTRWR